MQRRPISATFYGCNILEPIAVSVTMNRWSNITNITVSLIFWYGTTHWTNFITLTNYTVVYNDRVRMITYTSGYFEIEMATTIATGMSIQEPTVSAFKPVVDKIKLLYPAVNEDETPLPRSWSPKDKYNYIGLSQNNLRVHYKGTVRMSNEWHIKIQNISSSRSLTMTCEQNIKYMYTITGFACFNSSLI